MREKWTRKRLRDRRKKILKARNLIKIIFLITMTVLIQLEVIREKGHWVAGGNLAFPMLLAILLWWNTLFKKRLK